MKTDPEETCPWLIGESNSHGIRVPGEDQGVIGFLQELSRSANHYL